jgi:hypothetical protein
MAKSCVNIILLWDEYCQEASIYNGIPFMYTHFAVIIENLTVHKKPPRLSKKPEEQMEVLGQYSTVEDHMPDNHKSYSTWNSERFNSWA